MKRYTITESRLRNMIREAVISTLNEIDDSTIEDAYNKAKDEYASLYYFSPYYDNPDGEYPEFDKRFEKRKRQASAFRDELKRRQNR